MKILKMFLLMVFCFSGTILFSQQINQNDIDCINKCQDVPGPVSSSENFELNCINNCISTWQQIDQCSFDCINLCQDVPGPVSSLENFEPNCINECISIDCNYSAFLSKLKKVASKPELLNKVDIRAFEFFTVPTKSEPYAIQKTEMPQGIYEAVMEKNPSYYKGINRPVESVSFYDVYSFISRINGCGDAIVNNEASLKKVQKCLENKKTAGVEVYDLPTGAQWNNAAKGIAALEDNENYSQCICSDKNWKEGSCVIASKNADNYGIYDMVGNVWEWTKDIDDFFRVVCGGCWNNSAHLGFSHYRYKFWPDHGNYGLGFRLVRTSK